MSMGNKNFVLILGFTILTILGGKAHAGQVETFCAQKTKGYPPADGSSYDGQEIILQYNNCVKQTSISLEEQKNAPPNPGNPPVYDCQQYTGWKHDECEAKYNGAKAKYDADFSNYQEYQSAHPNMNNSIKDLSAAQIYEDITARQIKDSKELKRKAKLLKDIGTVLMTVGGLMLVVAIALKGGVFTTPAGIALFATGMVVLAAGAALLIASAVIEGKGQKIEDEIPKSCAEMNKLLTNPKSCDKVELQNPGDHTLTVTDYGFNGSNGTGDLPPFMDSATRKCPPGAAECNHIVKYSPKGCFDAPKPGEKRKGGSCLSGGDRSKIAPVKVLPSGKVVATVNGKQYAFGAEDFTDEASMMKAGFSKDQAKQFLSLMNDPNSILTKTGVNIKGELTKGSGIPTTSLGAPSSSASASGTGGTAGMNSKKDEYGPAKVQEVARTPASAEGLTKDYHGDTIGAEGDNVFKMINRRYNLKQKQNVFIEQ
jgi:hypothetical protein